MKTNLQLSEIGEVAEIFAGGDKPKIFSSFKSEKYSIPVFANGETNKGLQGFTDKAKVSSHAVTVSARGTIGYVVLRDEPFVPIVRLLTLIPEEKKLDLRYLYYYLFLHRQAGLGSSQSQLTVPDIANRKIAMHSLPTQQAIGKFFSVLDKKIELNRRINTELERIARMLYDYWFIQFDFPDASGKRYKSSGGAMKFSPELNREIPEGCEVQNMYANDLFDVIKPKIDKFVGTKQYIATADVNGLSITDGSPITYDGRESRANMQPKAYTVWFAKMKESIKHVLVGDYSEDLLNEAIFSTGFMGMQTDKEAFEYLSLTVHHPYFELVKDANSNGATMAAIGNNDMKNIKLLLPDERILAQFHEIARPILEKMDRNRQESQKLAHLRDWLLPMLMNGQVKVKG